jgi:hypothetical protein
MNTEMTLLKAVIDAWAINAKREKEAGKVKPGPDLDYILTDQFHLWEGQEIAFRRVQALLEKAGAV